VTVDQELRRAAGALERATVGEPDLDAAARRVRRRGVRRGVAIVAVLVLGAGAVVSSADDGDAGRGTDVVAGRDEEPPVLVPAGRVATNVDGRPEGLVAVGQRLVAVTSSPAERDPDPPEYLGDASAPDEGSSDPIPALGARAWVSDDGGTSWTPHTIDPHGGADALAVVSDGRTAVALVDAPEGTAPPDDAGGIWWSADGDEWLQVHALSQVVAVTWNGARFVALTVGGGWWSSGDGRTWAGMDRPRFQLDTVEGVVQPQPNDLVVGAGPWGTVIATPRDVAGVGRADAEPVTPDLGVERLGHGALVSAVAVGDELAVLGGRDADGPRIWTSSDGTAWAEHALPGSGMVEAIVPTDHGWAALVDQPGTLGPAVVTSTDGTTWLLAGPGGFDGGHATTLVAQGDGLVAVGTHTFRWSWTDPDDVATTSTPDSADHPAPPPAATAAELAQGVWYDSSQPHSPLGVGGPGAWTGSHLLVLWGLDDGGQLVDAGASYDPVADTWEVLPPSPLAPRFDAVSAWTGTEWMVVGGFADGAWQRTGAAFDPTAGTWREIPDAPFTPAAAVWMVDRLVIVDSSGTRAAAYFRRLDDWMGLLSPPRLADATIVGSPELVWDGSDLTLWRTAAEGPDKLPTTQGYVLRDHGWDPLGPASAVTAVGIVSIDGELIARAGSRCPPAGGCPAPISVGAVRFDPAVGWVASLTEGVAADADPVWTGGALVFAGCCLSTPDAFGEMQPVAGSAWDPLADAWLPLPTPPSPLRSPFVWLGDRLGSVGSDGILVLLPVAGEAPEPAGEQPLCPVPDACSGIRRGDAASPTSTVTPTS
jgi:hypothetical protein